MYKSGAFTSNLGWTGLSWSYFSDQSCNVNQTVSVVALNSTFRYWMIDMTEGDVFSAGIALSLLGRFSFSGIFWDAEHILKDRPSKFIFLNSVELNVSNHLSPISFAHFNINWRKKHITRSPHPSNYFALTECVNGKNNSRNLLTTYLLSTAK